MENRAGSFIHRFVAVEGSPKTLLVLHGTGGDETSLLGIAARIAPTWNLLSPRGKVLENGMARFFRRFAEGVFDEEDIRAQATDLADFVAASSTKYGFDQASVYAFGYSNGANIATSLLLLTPESLAGAMLVRGMVPLTPDPLPNLAGKEVLIVNGRFDPIGPEQETLRLEKLLRYAGAEVVLEMTDAGHELTRTDIALCEEWVRARR